MYYNYLICNTFYDYAKLITTRKGLMKKYFKFDKFNICISINSLVYFLIAYYIVVFSFNAFSMVLANSLGFDVELFYYGYVWSGKEWTTDYTILVFFVGNALTLLFAVIFERLYRNQRKYAKGIKLLYLWIYLIAIMWFLGNIIVGAVFNFGIGAAIRAYRIPFFLRVILAMIAIVSLLYLGYKAQKHVQVSANLYFPRLSNKIFKRYLTHQIVIPTFLGILIIILLKIPYVGMYNYADVVLLFTMVFFIVGLFYKRKQQTSIAFKTRGVDAVAHNSQRCSISFFPVIIMFIVLALVRIGLMDGVSF